MNTKVLVVAGLTPVLVLTVGVLLARHAHKQKRMANLATQIMVFAVVFSMLSAVVGLVLYSLEKRDYNVCLASVDARNDFRKGLKTQRSGWVSLQEEVEAKSNGQLHLESIDRFIAAIDGLLRDLPERFETECPRP